MAPPTRARPIAGRGRGPLLALLVLALASLGGCHLPFLHPVRLREGTYAAVAASLQFTDGEHGSCDFSGCRDNPHPDVGLSVIQLSGGYAHLFTPNVGVLIGGTILTMRDQRLDEPWGGTSLTLFGTVQSDEEIAFGMGAEVGLGSITVEAALEATAYRWDDHGGEIGITLFGRRTQPWTAAPPTGERELNPSVPSFDVGLRVSVWRCFVQYSLFRLDRGLIHYVVWESSTYAEVLHVLTFGLTFDGSIFDD